MRTPKFSRIKKSLILSAAVASALAIGRSAAHADFVWDPDGAGGVPATGGSGNWNGTNVWFDESTTAYTNWPAVGTEAIARFEGTGGLVTITSPVETNGLVFMVDGYTVGGAGTLTLVGPSLAFPIPILSVTNQTDTATINASLAGTLGVFKGGAGTLVLGGDNSALSGNIVISEGVLGFSADNNLGAAANAVDLVGGALRFTPAGALTTNRDINGLGGSLDIANAGGNLTTTGIISGSLTKLGAGTLTIDGVANTLSTLNIDDGTVMVGNMESLASVGSLGVGSSVVPTIGFFNYTGPTPAAQFSASVTLGMAGGVISVDQAGATLELSGGVGGGVADPGGAPQTLVGLTKTGPGTLKLSGGNSFTGNLLVTGGVVEINNDLNLGDGYNGVTLDGGTLRVKGEAGVDPGAGGTAPNSKFRIFRIGDNGGTIDVQLVDPTTSAPLTFLLNDGPLFAAPNQFASVNPDPVNGSPDVFTKTGPGTLTLGNANDSYANSFTGTTIIRNGLVRLDNAGGLGKFQITVTDDPSAAVPNTGVLGHAAAGVVVNPIVLENGGTLGSIGGDRHFSGPITLNNDWAFNPADLANPLVSRDTTLSGPITSNDSDIAIGAFVATGRPKGLTIAGDGNLSNLETSRIIVPAGAMLSVGGSGTGAGSVTGLTNAQIANNVQLLDGGVFGLRSDEATTFGDFPTLPATNFGLNVDRLSGAATGLTLSADPLNLADQTVTVTAGNGYRLAPSTLSIPSNPTIRLNGAVLIPGVITSVGTAANTVTIEGDNVGQLVVNNEAGGPHVINGTTFDLKGARLVLQGGTAGVDPLGGANVAFNGGALGLTSSAGGAVFDKAIAITNALGRVQHLGHQTDTYGAGAIGFSISSGGALSLEALGGTLNVATPVSGAGDLNVSGTAAVNLQADNSPHTGVTNLNGGTLVLSNVAGNSIGGNLGVSRGTVDLAGTTQTLGAVNLTGGTISNGTLGSTSIAKSGGVGSVAEISARIDGAAGGISVSGGTLRVTNTASGAGANNITGPVSASGGFLQVHNAAGGSDPLAGRQVDLSGGTLRLTGTNSTASGLVGTYYTFSATPDTRIANTLENFDTFTNPLTPALVSSTITNGRLNLDFSGIVFNGNPFSGADTLADQGLNADTNYHVKYSGKINITQPGPTLFGTTSDDGSMTFIDGQLVSFNNFPQGAAERSGWVDLTAGEHDIVILFNQGTGGAGLQAHMTPLGGVRTLIPNSILTNDRGLTLDTDLNVTGTGSALTIVDALSAQIGDIKLGGTLRVNGTVLANSMTVIVNGAEINTPGVSSLTTPGIGRAGNVDMIKSGTGTLVISGPDDGQGTIVVAGGTLRVTHSDGLPGIFFTYVNNLATLHAAAANIKLTSANVAAPRGRLLVSADQSVAAGAAVPTTPIAGIYEIRSTSIGNDFDGVTLDGGATWQFSPDRADRSYNSDVTLNGQVTLNSISNSVFINGVTSGTGGITTTGGTFNIDQPATFTGAVRQEGGATRFRNASHIRGISELTLFGGEINANDNPNSTTADRVADTLPITIYSGTLNSFMRNSGGTHVEDVGPLNVKGAARVNAQAGTGTSVVGYQFDSLTRDFGSRIAFDGTSLGGTATNHGEIKFDTAPTVTNGVIGGFAVVNNADFANYGANGIVAATSTTVTEANLTATGNHKLALPAAGVTLTGDRSANTLVINATGAATLNFNDHTLTLGTGGLLVTGSGLTRIGGAIPLTTPGRLTSAGDELFINWRTSADNAILEVTALIDGTQAVVTNTGSNAGNALRLRNTANSFTGGVYVNGGIFEIRGEGDTGNTMGTGPLVLNGGQANLRDASGGGYGNNVIVNANSTIDVNRPGTAGSNITFDMGNLTIGEGRTITLQGGNGYRIDFDNVTLSGTGGTYNNTSANSNLTGVVTVPAGATFTKSGGAFLTFTGDSDSTYLGTTRITGGNLQVASINGLGLSDATHAPVIDVQGGQLVVSVADLNLSNTTIAPTANLVIRAQQDNAAFRPAGVLPGISLSGDANISDSPGLGADYDLTFAPGANIVFTAGTFTAATLAGDITGLGDLTLNQTGGAAKTVDINGVISGPGTLTKNQSSGTFTVNLNAPNTYAGGTRQGFGASGGILRANVTGALSTGPVEVNSGFLELHATAAADNNVSILNGQILYNANEAAGGNMLSALGTRLNTVAATPTSAALGSQVGQINLTDLVTSVGADTFNIAPGNVIRGGSTQLSLLNRNASGTNAANITLAPGAIVAHATADTAAPTIADLGTAADLWFGLGANFGGQNLTIGNGTPWRGLSTDWNTTDVRRTWTTGVITVTDGTPFIDLANNRANTTGNHALALGAANNPGTLSIVKSGGAPVPANVYGRIILFGGSPTAGLSDYSGISQFVVQAGGVLQLAGGFNLGGGNGTTPVPVLVKAGGQIDPGADQVGGPAIGATLNANATIEPGGIVQINDPQNLASSTGSILAQSGSIALLEGASNDILANLALDGPAPALASYGTTPGIIVRLNRNNTNFLNETFHDASIFQLWNGTRQVSSGLDISGGGLTNDGTTRQLASTGGAEIRIGPGGATFSATTNTDLEIVANIAAPDGGTPGDITTGSDPIAGLNKIGEVRILGASNVFRNLTAARGYTELSDADGDQFDISGVMLVKDGALLRLNGNRTGLGDELRTASNGGSIMLEKGGFLDLKVRTSNDVYNTPIVLSGAGSGFTHFTFDEDTGTGIATLNDVTFNEGAEVRFTINDMGRTEARMNGKVAGNATVRLFNADFSFTNLQNTSAAPVTLVTGSVNETVARNIEILGALGTTGQPLTIEQIRAGIILAQGSSMGATTVINNLGSSHAVPLPANGDPSTFTSATSANLVDGFVQVFAGRNGTGAISAGTINLGGGKVIGGLATPPQDVRIFVDEAATGDQIVNTLGATVNVVVDSIAWINADRGTDSTVAGRGRFGTVNLAGNSQLYLESRADQEVEVANLNVAANGTIQNISHNSKVLVGNVAGAASSKVTFDGSNITQLIGNVTGLDPASGGEVIVRNRGVEAQGGAGAISIGAPVKVYTSFAATNGTVNLGSNPITGANGTVAGLREGVVYNSGALDESSANTGTNIRLGPVMANSPTAGWVDPNNPNVNKADQQTYIYTGEIFVANRGDGIGELAFGESVDDGVTIAIDGAEVLDDRVWNVNTASGKLEYPVTGAGSWLPIEIRVHNGGGGAGPSNQQGWAALGTFFPFGLGVDRTGPAAAETTLPVQRNYEIAADNGSMDLFRTTVASAGTVGVSPGATLNAGNVTSIARFNVNGAANVANVDATDTTVGNGTDPATLTANYVRGNSLTINAAATAILNTSTDLPAAGPLASNPNTSDVSALTIAGATDAWTGTLDIKNNDMVVRTPGGPERDTAYANALNQVKSGLNQAGGVFWAGPGIQSSTAAADSGGILTAVGVILNDFAQVPGLPAGPIVSEFSTRTVNENDMLIKYTWFGDADLNGVVDATDYSLIDNAFNLGLLNGGWLNGDFSYDGVVDATDYSLIDNAFNSQTGPLSDVGQALLPAISPAAAAAVPEPSVVALLAIGSLGLLGRRRRRA